MKIKTYRMTDLNKGSLTVEASVIIPMILLITAALLTLTFFKANENFYFAGACEAALAGNERCADIRENQAGYNKAKERAEECIRGQVFPGSSPESKVICTAGGTKVLFSGQRFAFFPKEWFEYSIDVHVDRIRPADGLRHARAAAGMLRLSDE